MTGLICHSVREVDDCAITVIFREQPVTVAFSSDLAAFHDELRCTAQACPCLQALYSGTVVESTDLTRDTRWDRYPAVAVSRGMRSVLSLPLDAGAAGPGALHLYSHTVRGFTETGRHAAREFAVMTANVVAAAVGAEEEPDDRPRLNEVLARRSQVAQVVGMFMAGHGCTRDEAFRLVVQASRARDEDVYAFAARTCA